jgi:hypothetical protein
MPPDRIASYPNYQCFVKNKDGKWVKRVRVTYGGDKKDYKGESSSSLTADLTDIKLHTNAIISTPGKRASTIDIKDFYLKTSPIPNGRVEFMWVPLSDIPEKTQLQYNVKEYDVLIGTVWKVLVIVEGGMYGLKYAGLIAKLQLDQYLAEDGFYEKKNTPCLYEHEIRPITFNLVVDDFLIGADVNGVDSAYLKACLRKHYDITEGDGSNYVGITMNWDYANKKVTLSMPGYVDKALARFGVVKGKPEHRPSPFEAPVHGRKGTPTMEEENPSPPLSKAEIERLQQIIGVFLFYARAVDATMFPALNMLARSKKTQIDMEAAEQFMQYAATWSNAHLVYHASDMCLHLQSDLGYLNERDAKSRVGGLGFLGNKPTGQFDSETPLTLINGAVLVTSTVLKVVVSSACEGEYGAMFMIGQEGERLRNTLADLGFPQGATPLQGDNKVAVGIANDNFKQRRSKAIDMRFHWIRDRVRQGHFKVYWRAGNNNLADYFTKNHSAKHHRAMRRFFVTDTPLVVPPDTARARRLQRRQ